MDLKSIDVEWPCYLPESLKETLMSIAVYKKGVSAFEVTEKYTYFPGLFYIIRGSCGLCFSTQDMSNIVGGVIGRHDWIGATSINSQQKFFCIAEEVEPMHMLLFPQDKMFTLAEQEPQIYSFLYYTTQKFQQTWLQTLLFTIHNRQQRIIFTLLELRARQETMLGAVDCIKISQYQLSTISGVSRSRLNETLKDIEKRGYISLMRNKIFLLKLPALQQMIKPMNLMTKDPRAS